MKKDKSKAGDRSDEVEELLREGKYFLYPDGKYTILDFAHYGDFEQVKHLLTAHPSSVNDQDDVGLTIAHIGVFSRNFDLLELATQTTGFDPAIKDNFGRRAIDCIIHPNMERYSKLLMKHMYGVFSDLDGV